jgi:hypothetical protein
MSAHTKGSTYDASVFSKDGIKVVYGQFTGSAAYDAGGSVLDLSGEFSDEVRTIIVQPQGTTEYQPCYVPDTGNAPATCKVFLADGGGTEVSGSLAAVTFDFIAVGTDA